MGLQIGIVGLPNAGKSTLFNALASRRLAETAPRPFTTIEPHEAVVAVPDKWFDRLYLSKKGTKEIRGAVEGRGIKNLVLEYENFDSNICTSTNLFDDKYGSIFSGIKCEKDGNTYYVLAQGTDSYEIDPDEIWNDLTAKLR